MRYISCNVAKFSFESFEKFGLILQMLHQNSSFQCKFLFYISFGENVVLGWVIRIYNYFLWIRIHNYFLWIPIHNYFLWIRIHNYFLWIGIHNFVPFQLCNILHAVKSVYSCIFMDKGIRYLRKDNLGNIESFFKISLRLLFTKIGSFFYKIT